MFVVLLALASALLAPLSAADPLPTRIGALVATSELFDRKLVKLTAYVRTDGRHIFVLLDQADSDQGVALLIPGNARRDAAVKELIGHIYVPPREFMSHQVRGTFTGTFEWRQGVVPSRVLVLMHVEDIEITKTVTESFALRFELSPLRPSSMGAPVADYRKERPGGLHQEP
jgi:hypothetical protein